MADARTLELVDVNYAPPVAPTRRPLRVRRAARELMKLMVHEEVSELTLRLDDEGANEIRVAGSWTLSGIAGPSRVAMSGAALFLAEWALVVEESGYSVQCGSAAALFVTRTTDLEGFEQVEVRWYPHRSAWDVRRTGEVLQELRLRGRRLRLDRAALPTVVVGCAILGALAGRDVSMPSPVPSWALQAPVVYRAEVGLVIFAVLYFAVTALTLALRGRTFTRFGAAGASIEIDVEAAEGALAELAEADQRLASALSEAIAALEERLRDLEDER